jgi:hypothetical protein
MNILPFIIQLVSGAVGGCMVSGACHRIRLGAILSLITGMLGGQLGGRSLQLLVMDSPMNSASDVKIFLTCILGGAAGGAALTALLGWIKVLLSRRL